jgi:hypothetical protein
LAVRPSSRLQCPRLEHRTCGLLFLGTPHSGSTSADFNKFISNLSALFGVRVDILNKLRSFNGFAVSSKEAFRRIKPSPPYACLCESKRTNVAGTLQLVSLRTSLLSSRSLSNLYLPKPYLRCLLIVAYLDCYTRFGGA